MAAFELLLSEARRRCLTKASRQLNLLLRSNAPVQHSTRTLSFLGFQRSLCSSSSPSDLESPAESQSSEATPKPQPPKIQAVSYAAKPKDASASSPQEDSQFTPLSRRAREQTTQSDRPFNAESQTWTREDIRYMKDMSKISPVSYPTRVAPLPEDNVAAASADGEGKEEVAKGGEESKDGDWQFERERKRLEADKLMTRWRSKVEEEKVPFPTLIKLDKKKEKVVYDLKEAIRLVKANAKANFIETVEIHANLTNELSRSHLKLDGAAVLPHGTGKTVKIAVFADGSAADDARAAGADVVGGVELVEGIKNGNIKVDFDICITTHQFVGRLQKLGSVLRRLMPSPKAGTVTDDVAKAVRESKRVVKIKKESKTAVVHAGIGKVNFSEEALHENIGAFVNALLLAKPAGLKKSSKYAGYVNSVHICSSMGPGFPVSIQSLSIAADRYTRLQIT